MALCTDTSDTSKKIDLQKVSVPENPLNQKAKNEKNHFMQYDEP